jgi:hypothetical protein
MLTGPAHLLRFEDASVELKGKPHSRSFFAPLQLDFRFDIDR